jgi:hypothetical protein
LSFLARSVGDYQQFQNVVFIYTNTFCDFCKLFVRLIACYIHYVQIEKFLLVFEQGRTEFPEFFWGCLENRGASFVRERRCRMPRLNVLAGNNLDA